MICYLPFGIVFLIIGVFQVVCLFISIVGIPAALVVANSLGTYLNPVNKKCVPQAVADEIAAKKAQEAISTHLG